MTVRVVLADDQELVRAGFRMILEAEPDIEVVAEAPDGAAAVVAVRRHRPDVVLMDVQMPVLDGLARPASSPVPTRGCSSSPLSSATTTSSRRYASEQAASC